MAWKWPGVSKSGSGEEWTGFIDQGVTLEGTLQLKGTFRIDGNVRGNIISEQTVVLGEGAKVEGQVPAAPNGDAGFARRAEGNTKKLAEQRAAQEAWDFLQSLKRGS